GFGGGAGRAGHGEGLRHFDPARALRARARGGGARDAVGDGRSLAPLRRRRSGLAPRPQHGAGRRRSAAGSQALLGATCLALNCHIATTFSPGFPMRRSLPLAAAMIAVAAASAFAATDKPATVPTPAAAPAAAKKADAPKPRPVQLVG